MVLRQQRRDSSQASGAVSQSYIETISPFTVHSIENINTLIVITVFVSHWEKNRKRKSLAELQLRVLCGPSSKRHLEKQSEHLEPDEGP